MNVIDNLDEAEAKKTLHLIAEIYNIGALARTPSVILANVCNSAKHEFCIKRPSSYVIECALKMKKDNLLREYILDAESICDDDDGE